MRATTRVCVHLRVVRRREASGRTSRVGVSCSAGTGKVVVITGANTGLGKVTAQQLSAQGFTVVGACRNVEKGEEAAREFQREGGSTMDVLPLDLSSLDSVRAFAAAFTQRYQHCDVLINNAGVMAPPSRQTTTDGFELQVRCACSAAALPWQTDSSPPCPARSQPLGAFPPDGPPPACSAGSTSRPHHQRGQLRPPVRQN